MRSLRNKSSGFTIIELLIVIVVIAILAGLVLNAFGNIQARARDTERRNDINAIHRQLELYYTDNSAYPAALTDLPNLNPDALEAPGADEDYSYTPAPADCTTAAGDCTSYSLSAELEAEEGDFELNSLN